MLLYEKNIHSSANKLPARYSTTPPSSTCILKDVHHNFASRRIRSEHLLVTLIREQLRCSRGCMMKTNETYNNTAPRQSRNLTSPIGEASVAHFESIPKCRFFLTIFVAAAAVNRPQSNAALFKLNYVIRSCEMY